MFSWRGSWRLWCCCELLALTHVFSKTMGYIANWNNPYMYHGSWLTSHYSITFLGALIYASVIYHRHRRAKSRFFRSVQGTDLFPVIADEGSHPVHSHRTFRAPRTSIKEFGSGAEVSYPAELKEAVEVTVLRELGGDWDVYELAATRSARSSKGGKSVRSMKGVR